MSQAKISHCVAMSKPKELTTADLVVLAVLLGHPPMHGYELVKKLEASDVEDWASISMPQVYYSLRKMAKLGHIVPADGSNPSLGPSRVTYKPAEHALDSMKMALKHEAWVHHRIPTPFVTWTALAMHADVETIDRQFDRRASFLKAEIQREEETLVTLETAKGPGIKIAQAMVSLAISQMQAEADRLEQLRDAIISERGMNH